MTDIILHGYWRSSASYRVRIALNLKNIGYRQVTHDLREGEHHDPDYLALAPHGLVPSLEIDGKVAIESPAILEWIEARWPYPPLLPDDLHAAALVRAMAALIACEIHPLCNLRVLQSLRGALGASDGQVADWIVHWTGEGLTALEALVGRHGGAFAFGDTPTLADCYIVPQLYNAVRFGVDLSSYPRLVRVGETAARLPAFTAAHPDRQPDAPE